MIVILNVDPIDRHILHKTNYIFLYGFCYKEAALSPAWRSLCPAVRDPKEGAGKWARITELKLMLFESWAASDLSLKELTTTGT
jgi:hypothetical protein